MPLKNILYNTIYKYSNYLEVRDYYEEEMLFICLDKPFKKKEDIYILMDEMFIELFKFINGNNDEGKIFNMTIPVILIFNKNIVSMGFYLNQNKMGNLNPLNKNIYYYIMKKTKFITFKNYSIVNLSNFLNFVDFENKTIVLFYDNPKEMKIKNVYKIDFLFKMINN